MLDKLQKASQLSVTENQEFAAGELQLTSCEAAIYLLTLSHPIQETNDYDRK